MKRRTATLLAAVALASAGGQAARGQGWNLEHPEAEFHIARLMPSGSQAYRGGYRQWYAIDWPEAEDHLSQGLQRLTLLEVADDSVHVRTIDDRIFNHPWLFAQQVGRWTLSDEETDRLREYLMRGGFLVVDDFHGEYEWRIFHATIQRVLPGYPIIEIPDDDPLLHVLYDLNRNTQIPGARHLYRGPGGQIMAQLPGGAGLIGGASTTSRAGCWSRSTTTWTWETPGSTPTTPGTRTHDRAGLSLRHQLHHLRHDSLTGRPGE